MAGSPRRELFTFAVVLAATVGGFFAESLFGGRLLSPADVLFASGSFADVRGPSYEPVNRLLIDPVLQFQPWLEFNRGMIRSGRLPLWNPMAGCGAPHLANGQSAVFDPFHLDRLPRRLSRASPLAGWGGGSPMVRWRGDVPPGEGLGVRPQGTVVLGLGVPVLRVPDRLASVPGHERGRLDALGLPGDRGGLRSAFEPAGRMPRAGGRRDLARRARPDERPRPARGRGLRLLDKKILLV